MKKQLDKIIDDLRAIDIDLIKHFDESDKNEIKELLIDLLDEVN